MFTLPRGGTHPSFKGNCKIAAPAENGWCCRTAVVARWCIEWLRFLLWELFCFLFCICFSLVKIELWYIINIIIDSFEQGFWFAFFVFWWDCGLSDPCWHECFQASIIHFILKIVKLKSKFLLLKRYLFRKNYFLLQNWF